ncbi:MAG: S26 family signal peptidase [Ruminococcaceae bacterium]|nr:S26 family signal peptidase [Oscillospiraceae bacterium]
MEKQSVKKVLKGIGRGFGIALVIFEVLIIIFLVVSKVQGNPPTLFGYQMYFIRTGSMSPYLEPGDVIISKKYDGGELIAGNDGSIVTYYGDVKGNVEMITHRVIEIDGDKVITQGDANNTADSPISKGEIEAVMVHKTVVIDKIYKIITTTWGFWLCIFTPIALLIVFEIVSLVKELKKEKEVAEENEENKE